MNKWTSSLLLFGASSSLAHAASGGQGNMSAIIMFLVFIAGTMVIT